MVTAAKITQGKILCCYYNGKFRLLRAGHCFYTWNVQAIYFFAGWCTQVLEPCSFPLSFLCTAQDNHGIKTWLVLTSLGFDCAIDKPSEYNFVSLVKGLNPSMHAV